MDDLVQAVVDEVLRRQGQRPALLVGRGPHQFTQFFRIRFGEVR